MELVIAIMDLSNCTCLFKAVQGPFQGKARPLDELMTSSQSGLRRFRHVNKQRANRFRFETRNHIRQGGQVFKMHERQSRDSAWAGITTEADEIVGEVNG
jgi:hypothetical protein